MEADPTTTEAVVATAAPAAPAAAPTAVPKIPKTKATMGPFNILSHLVSLPVVGAAVWLFCMRDYDCEDILRVNMPTVRISIGFGLLLVFCLSNVAVLAKGPKILPVFFVTMFLMIVIFIVGVALVGGYPMESRGMPGSPIWLKRRVTSNGNWNNIKACIYDSGICDDLAARTAGLSSYEFNMKRLSHIESGCCRPPAPCGMQYINSTWVVINDTNTAVGRKDTISSRWFFAGDCASWGSPEAQLCYGCQSCQRGYLATLRDRWYKLGVILIVVAVILTLLHSVRFVVLMMLLQHGAAAATAVVPFKSIN